MPGACPSSVGLNICTGRYAMGCDSKLFILKRILYIGGFIYISRRNLELVKVISGAMLIAYVSVATLVQELGARSVVDAATVLAVNAMLDVPTVLALVVFVGLTVRLELFKPKYKLPVRRRPMFDLTLLIAGILISGSFIALKYL